MRLAGTVAVNCVELTKLVVSAGPFHVISVAGVNPEPLTVRRNDGPPAIALLGCRLVSPKLMKKVSGDGELCPDCTTVTLAVPTDAMRLAGMVVVSWPELTKLVVWVAPFQVIEVELVNPDPLTVRRKAGP